MQGCGSTGSVNHALIPKAFTGPPKRDYRDAQGWKMLQKLLLKISVEYTVRYSVYKCGNF